MPGAVKVTTAPLTGFPPLSLTVAWSAAGKAVPTVVLCGVPDVAVTLAPTRAAALRVTFPPLRAEDMTQLTVSVWPAVPAL